MFLRALRVAALIAGLSSAAPAQPTELVFNSYLPAADPAQKVAVLDFARRIEAESAGTLKVAIPESSLAPSPEQWDLVTRKGADIVIVAHYSQRVRLKLPMIADLPLNALSAESASMALWDVQQKYFSSANEYAGVKLLAMYVLPPRQLIANRAIKAYEDFESMKIWAPAGDLTDLVRGLGAAPVYSTLADLHEYAAKKSVDAFLIGPGTIAQEKVDVRGQTMLNLPGGFGSVSFSIVMNADTWNRLTNAQRAAVQRAASGLPQRVGRAFDERERAGVERLGLTINHPSADLLRRMQWLLKRQELGWIEMARVRGIGQPEIVLKAYREEMERSYHGPAVVGGQQ
jgi:TRAP-type C4-dicarboxylate transport system substrate-binding protein